MTPDDMFDTLLRVAVGRRKRTLGKALVFQIKHIHVTIYANSIYTRIEAMAINDVVSWSIVLRCENDRVEVLRQSGDPESDMIWLKLQIIAR